MNSLTKRLSILTALTLLILLFQNCGPLADSNLSLSSTPPTTNQIENESGNISPEIVQTPSIETDEPVDQPSSLNKKLIVDSYTVKATGEDYARISWSVSDFSQSYIEFGPTESFGSLSVAEESFSYKDHNQTISGLKPNTKYYYRIHATDKDGNKTVSKDGSFQTNESQLPTDNEAPNLVGYNELRAPATDRAYGQFSEADVDMMVAPLKNVFTIGINKVQIKTLDGRRALTQRLIPTPTGKNGTDRVMFDADLPKNKKEVFLAQSLRFAPDAQYGGTSRSGKIGWGISGGESASGGKPSTKGFSLRVAWFGLPDGTAEWALYEYSAKTVLYGQSRKNLNKGKPFVIRRGEWVDHITRIRVNSKPGVSDGVLQHWINGVRVYSATNVEFFRDSGSRMAVEELRLGSFYGGGPGSKYAPSATQYLSVSDVGYKLP